MDKTPDAYRTISEVADDLDLPQHVLRFWETRFGQIKPLKRAGGRRFYRPDDVDLLKGIRHLLYNEGYTIKGVQRILKDQGVRAILALVRNNGLEAEPEAAIHHSAIATERMIPLVVQPTLPPLRQEVAWQEPLRHEPPPLATLQTAPEWRTPLDLEANFSVFHAQDEADYEAETQEDDALRSVVHADLPPPPAVPSHAAVNPFVALPLNFGAPFQVPFSPSPAPGRVSMVRGGIALQQKSGSHSTPLLAENAQSANRMAPVVSTPAMPIKQTDHERDEARAILTLALEELATCREMIEALHAPLRAAE